MLTQPLKHLAASILLHASIVGVLTLFSASSNEVLDPETLSVSLVSLPGAPPAGTSQIAEAPAAQSPAVTQPEPPKPDPVIEKPKPPTPSKAKRISPKKTTEKLKDEEKEAPEPEAAPPQATETVADATHEGPATTGVPGGVPGAGVVDGVPGGGGGVGGVGTGSLGRGDPVLAALIRAIEANKYYPRAARRAGIEGRVTIRISIRDGRITAGSLYRACGKEVLDDAARNLGSALVGVAIPAARGKSITVTVPVQYALTRR